MTEIAPVVTIDGPSGSGKGTISRELADRLGWHYLDSGALYRLTALAALRAQVPLTDTAALARSPSYRPCGPRCYSVSVISRGLRASWRTVATWAPWFFPPQR
jgi:hypothetical protein